MFQWEKELVALTEISESTDLWDMGWKNNEAPMIVLTPVFPEMNSLHNTIESTARIIQQEFFKAFLQLKRNGNEDNKYVNWHGFFHKGTYFFDHVDYILLLKPTIREAKFQEEAKEWADSVYHKTRILLKEIETVENIWPRPFPSLVSDSQEYYILIGIEISPTKNEPSSKKFQISLRKEIHNFVQSLAGSSETKWYYDFDLELVQKQEFLMNNKYQGILNNLTIPL